MHEDGRSVGDFEGEVDVLLDEHDHGASVVGDAAHDGKQRFDDDGR